MQQIQRGNPPQDTPPFAPRRAQESASAPLYDPAFEHDACGVGFVARLEREPVHEVVDRALIVLENMEHRGAEGADPETGDGAGILLQIPDEFFRAKVGFELPAAGEYGVAMCFLPYDGNQRSWLEHRLEEVVAAEGLRVLGWRDVPVDRNSAGKIALASAPYVKQLFVAAGDGGVAGQDPLERQLYVARRVFEHEAGEDAPIVSMSTRTIVYKGMLAAPQLPNYFPDLRDPLVKSQVAVVHSRFSTNTFPSWELAHPFRLIAHNGEINTLRGNRNWMRARESQLKSELFGDDIHKLHQVVRPGGSDSAAFDNVLEFLTLAGRSVAHGLMMMIPEAYEQRADLSEAIKDFYRYESCMMEPWDGPAAVAFCDGRQVGAMLDRNGLRPVRWIVTKDGYVVLASEAGVLPVAPEDVQRKGRLSPGRFFCVDLETCELVEDAELMETTAAQLPYGEWCSQNLVHLDEVPERGRPAPGGQPLRTLQLAFGYSQEDLRVLLEPMIAAQAEPIGSMGNDLALAALSDRKPSLFNYFKQLFAQVTNPPIDPMREQMVMSLLTRLGNQGNILEETPERARQLIIDQPILGSKDIEKIRHLDRTGFRARTIDITWPVDEGPAGMESALVRICHEARTAIDEDATIVILSDRELSPERAPIPSLLAVAAVHQHLVNESVRLRASLIIESGEPREVHHMAALIGFGAAAIHPYLAFETIDNLTAIGHMPEEMSVDESERRLIKALGKGLLKVISKMGISTIHSYRGAQLFEALGLSEELIDKYFRGTPSRVGGVGLETLAQEALDRHGRAYEWSPEYDLLPVGGIYQWRRQGESRAWSPTAVSKLQNAVGLNPDAEAGAVAYEEFAKAVNDESAGRLTLRGLMRMRPAGPAVPLEEVEPISEIVKRFSTGGISLGAISVETHEVLAQAMNRLGGRSNTGEGGEDSGRFGDDRRSAIKQVASGRFGVTIDYLANADQLQIKIAQGAKPGEGGQLPGPKVSPYIAKLRHSTAGVGLISPPPHHDIYSIEDLKQLIHDLRCANPTASVSVKLVAAVGVGTVAAGVAKAGADHVTIAGDSGGTAASPQSSIYHAGLPWELGLAETQQTLMLNNLRNQIAIEVDGQLKTGRDVVIGALLGADQFGFATAPLIAVGCIMMRVCHLNTCPVGIATQNPELRRRFRGTPEQVVNYFLYLGEEVRQIMAELGFRRFEEMIGRADLLEQDPQVLDGGGKAASIDLSAIIQPAQEPGRVKRYFTGRAASRLEEQLDWQLIERAQSAIDGGAPVELETPITNVDRSVGGVLSNAVALRHGAQGLPEGSIKVGFSGSAGQSFGAWLAPGVDFTLAGDANDYTGKGLSGGTLAVHPPAASTFPAEHNVIAGNAVLYGATGGKAFFSGTAGERFAVRNSGAVAVVEGVGDHGCEYMTGGRVTVLGPTGENFAAGMSGGIAYVHDPRGIFKDYVNSELVELEPVAGADADELRADIEEHVARTGSAIGRRLLDTWPAVTDEFVKVMPGDYKRALEELEQKAERVSPEGATSAHADAPGALHSAAPATLQLPFHDEQGNTEDYDEIRVEPYVVGDGAASGGAGSDVAVSDVAVGDGAISEGVDIDG